MAAPKKRKRKAKGEVVLDGIEPFTPDINIEHPDGSVTITINPSLVPSQDPSDSKFEANLAEELDASTLASVSASLTESIQQHERDRSEWLQQRADGIDLLGAKIERPGAGGNVGSTSTGVPGQSTVRDGILGEACDRFQANAFSEMCPSEGPCKIINYGLETAGPGGTDDAAEQLQKDINYYLTTTATEYYPDTRKMLWWVGYASGMFKKIYKCPIRNRPVSESVDGADLIVPSNATDLRNAEMITHQINMSHTTLKRMQYLGVYRSVPLAQPTPIPNALTSKIADITGLNANQQLPADQSYTIYECYCNLDLRGYEHTDKDGKPTGLPLPYRVTLDKDSREILEVRRNWAEVPESDDEDSHTHVPVAKIPFVAFHYTTGLGFYGTGLLHRIGNYAMALTAMLRECIDAGMFASFPGFLYAKPMGRQLQNEFRVPPGGGAPIDVSATGNDISKAIMPLPYKDVSGAFVQLMAQTRDVAARYGSAADLPVGEGRSDAPVGTTLALLEAATKVEGGVHKALHAAQREELGQLLDLLKDDPEAMWRGNKRPAMGMDRATRIQKFRMAVENCDLVPASDPNVPSQIHRLAKANTLLQTATGMPGIFDTHAVLETWAQMVKIDNIRAMFAPPQAAEPPPILPLDQAKLALQAQDLKLKEAALALKAHTDQQNRQSKETIEAAKVAQQAHSAANQPQEQPQQTDPLQLRALEIKQQQVDQAAHKMHIDAWGAHQERENKQTLKGMDIAARLATHPESTPEVNSELAGLDRAGYMTPTDDMAANRTGPSRGSGGGVWERPQPYRSPVAEVERNPESEAVLKSLHLAKEIEMALHAWRGGTLH